MGLHLSHPVDRWRLLAIKLATLTMAVATLCVVGWHTVPVDSVRTRGLMLGLGMLSAVTIAPALTMLCRTPLAGAVFTLAIPALSWVAADIAGAIGGTARDSGSRMQLQIDWLTYATVAAAAASSVGLWILNRTLEAADHRGAPDTRDAAPSEVGSAPAPVRRRRHPAWLLLKKELHLQQLPLFVAALFLVIWTVVTLSERFTHGAAVSAMPVMTVIYLVITPLLIGALASAEERQLGTLEWQRLLPMPAWQQWSIKVATVLALSTALAIGLPVLLATIHPSADDVMFRLGPVSTVIALAITALYVSSLAPRGLWALLVSVPAIFCVVAVMAGILSLPVWAQVSRAGWLTLWQPLLRGGYGNLAAFAARSILAVASASVVLVVLRFAAANHHSEARSRARLVRQAGWIGVALTIWIVVVMLTVPISTSAVRLARLSRAPVYNTR
ncbi:MAG: hypothetical protein ABIX28_21825 [Vicinamibacterales bacterium]